MRQIHTDTITMAAPANFTWPKSKNALDKPGFWRYTIHNPADSVGWHKKNTLGGANRPKYAHPACLQSQRLGDNLINSSLVCQAQIKLGEAKGGYFYGKNEGVIGEGELITAAGLLATVVIIVVIVLMVIIVLISKSVKNRKEEEVRVSAEQSSRGRRLNAFEPVEDKRRVFMARTKEVIQREIEDREDKLATWRRASTSNPLDKMMAESAIKLNLDAIAELKDELRNAGG